MTDKGYSKYDVVGSFLRPDNLKRAREEYARGGIGAGELTKIEDREIIALVEKQKKAGLRSVTDGEFRRSWWHLDFMWGFSGIEKVTLPRGYQFEGVETRSESARVTGPIRFESHPFLEHFRFLKENAGENCQARQTVPAPSQLWAEVVREENRESLDRIYPDLEKLKQDVIISYRKFITALYHEGCRQLQLDDCTWGLLCDSRFRGFYDKAGLSADDTARLYAELNNGAIAEKPADMSVTTHVCRGNYCSTWAMSGGYEPVGEVLFGEENVDCYYLEFDTERSGDFSPLRHINGDKRVVLGLVSSKTGEMENRKEIISRIFEAAQYVPLERLSLSPQCGFASTEEGNLLTEEQQWNKLRFIKDVAREVWGER
ncbi:MAG: 5-methyltetrahydropteroyltriglutamate--homocysteine S-methyltransferase [Spirochaetales bacterium]|nr:5-methyltetrahydropteroyltriglutamate--homocysteine S-methyltransferase [Spirochaetales bacterium]